MPAWLTRGLVLGVVHAIASVTVEKVAVFVPTNKTVLTSVTFALLIGVSLAWGSIDGWLRREDSGRNWVVAALIAGPVAGVLNVIGRAAFVDQTGASELGVQLTYGAAFVALLVLVPAAVGMLVGARLEPPRIKHAPVERVVEPELEPPQPVEPEELSSPARKTKTRPAAPVSKPSGKSGRTTRLRPAPKD